MTVLSTQLRPPRCPFCTHPEILGEIVSLTSLQAGHATNGPGKCAIGGRFAVKWAKALTHALTTALLRNFAHALRCHVRTSANPLFASGSNPRNASRRSRK
jgi:hypothetical protein